MTLGQDHHHRRVVVTKRGILLLIFPPDSLLLIFFVAGKAAVCSSNPTIPRSHILPLHFYVQHRAAPQFSLPLVLLTYFCCTFMLIGRSFSFSPFHFCLINISQQNEGDFQDSDECVRYLVCVGYSQVCTIQTQ